jgi:hypothetical protein
MFFNLFKKKTPEPAFRELVWMSTAAKWRAIAGMAKEQPQIVIAAWFPNSMHSLQYALDAAGLTCTVHDVRQIRTAMVAGKTLLLAEHYPLREKELPLLEMQAANVMVCSALDEPLFLHFGGGHLQELMQKLGSAEDEVLEHNMIKQAIARAQQSISEKITVDNSAASADAWFQRNMPAS